MCAACTILNKKTCPPMCGLKTYFPNPEDEKTISGLHRVFHATNVERMIYLTKVDERNKLIKSLEREARMRIENPVMGCIDVIEALEKRIENLLFSLFGLFVRNLPDDVIHNILSRLSAKPLMRFKCVSAYWNTQITESYFKSHRKLLLSGTSLYALKGKNAYSRVELPSPFETRGHWRKVLVVGTLYGIVVLALEREDAFQLMLYNPLTREANKLPNPPRSCCISAGKLRAYGFGYGYDATPHDSKIVIGYSKVFCKCSRSKSDRKYCHVFSLKRGSWTTPETDFGSDGILRTAGVFINGYLNWIFGYPGEKLSITVLDVEEMKNVTRMDAPVGTDQGSSCLGTLHKRLCVVTQTNSRFRVWVLNTERYLHKEWSKTYSFTGVCIGRDYHRLRTICILEDGRIVLKDSKSRRLIFYDPSKGFSRSVFRCTQPFTATGIEYVESLASPSDICLLR
ncbi:hypothetical protein OSB04_025870 [Centaurea solstitialis]|uniref:F-box domain-containing protein n=1 Tax=Centaurea solstitialis TaxID=347529 RepID=A0AA38SPG9_9ASTR|nr:hypothetical protein OSB04_025870 [Centaurea solstitialis]